MQCVSGREYANKEVLQGSPIRSPMKLPGHAERQDGPVTVDLPHPLSEEKVKQLDEECYERFIKVSVKHITDGQVSSSTATFFGTTIGLFHFAR